MPSTSRATPSVPGQAGGPAHARVPTAAATRALAKAEAAAKSVSIPSGVQFERCFAFAGGFAQQWRLANGLRVVIAPSQRDKVVAYHTWIAAGSADEAVGQTGAAHLLEHLMFKATQTQPGGAFDRILESFGASANATTWLDWTSFHEVIVPEKLAQVTALEADRLHRIVFEPVSVGAELEVVRNERRETVDDDPDGVLAEVLYRAAYGQAPYGHSTIGRAADLAKLTSTHAAAFYKQHYHPDGVWVVLTGAVDPAAALPMLSSQYGVIAKRAGQRPKRRTASLPKLGGPAHVTRIDAEADRLLVGWRTVGGAHADHPALAVLTEILANADSARLPAALVHKDGLAAHVSADFPMTRAPALLEVHVELLPGKSAVSAQKRLGELLTGLRDGRPISDAEVKAARNRLLVTQFASLSSADGRADVLGMFAATLADPAACVRWWSAIQRVTTADVRRVAKTWLVPSNRVVVRGEATADQTVEPPK
ncbi:MAG: insulinase family protein [Myxococcales bacterium]|nr:insulinase family protein [Myxococcales bacterium]